MFSLSSFLRKFRSYGHRRTLAERVFFAFAFLIGIVSLLYSVALVRTIEYVESSLVANIMHEKISLMEAELSGGRIPLQTEEIYLYGDFPGLTPIPKNFSRAPTGYSEALEEEAAFLYKRKTSDGHTLLLVFDQAAFEAQEQIFQNIVALSFVVVLLVALLVGFWLGRRIVNPIRALSSRVSAMAEAKEYRPLAKDFADDEVGRLASACDRAMERLFKAIERERRFTSDVSHELRSPLTVIRTSAECLELGNLDDRARKHVLQILRVTDETNDMLNVFLAFAREADMSHDLRDDVSSVLDRMLEVWGPVAEKKGLYFRMVKTGSVPGAFSPVLLMVVANNLVKNAVYYTDQGGITLTETATSFMVSDTGRGIGLEEQAHVFEPFYRGSASHSAEGAGVGLSIVQRIAERSGWKIDFESSPAGTTFTVTLTSGENAKRMDERS